ncbi:Gfo/Idh/MocA family oxidoreductase [Lignipirellula cremea]|uniref:Inositol 2-dehydrogenase n=1 Tax=Lignipirellula cremea TaxID=2528010 RepID=A0A518DSA6_9BACT|nr:Gfo/Idh/MocA family oxidoreductase [Lignipirellula cremea]QDU94721.1 Inositol 2-dehydrogenase [Lignipirellula cremea]
MKSPAATVSRRQFLQTAAVAGAVISAPMIVPARVFGANERILTGHIGLGGQGNSNLRKFTNQAAALCDVDSGHLARAMKTTADRGRDCAAFADYRKLLERKDIDAVVISTPDHWHAKTVVDACDAGKHVYCEKPLSLTIAEGRKMVEAARSNKRIVQTGSQQRSSSNFRYACELVRNGRIGKLQEVHVGIARTNHPFKTSPPPDSTPPAELDYDLWLGPAPERPYNEKRVHYNFRFFWDYSGGQMTNWGAHHIDIAQWGMGTDDSGPIAVEGTAKFHPQMWHEVTESCRIRYTYPSGVVMTVGQQQPDISMGTKFIGDKGTIFVDRGKLTSDPGDIIQQPIADDEIHLYNSSDHHGNFLDCIASGELPICDVEIGHRSATCCHLGNIAVRLGRKITWDPAAEKIQGDEEASALSDRPYRQPWTLG